MFKGIHKDLSKRSQGFLKGANRLGKGLGSTPNTWFYELEEPKVSTWEHPYKEALKRSSVVSKIRVWGTGPIACAHVFRPRSPPLEQSHTNIRVQGPWRRGSLYLGFRSLGLGVEGF